MGPKPLKRLDAVFLVKLRITLVLFIVTALVLVFGTTKVQSKQQLKMSKKSIDFWVNNYLRWHDAHRHNTSRVAVLLPSTDSLADQVSSIMNVWAFSVLTNRLVLLGVNQPFPLSNVISSHARERFGFEGYRDMRISTLRAPNIVHSDRGRLSYQQVRSDAPVVVLQLSKMKHPSALISALAKGKKVPPFSLEVRRRIARLLLEPSNAVTQAVNSFSTQHGLCTRDQQNGRQTETSNPCTRHISIYAQFKTRYGRRNIAKVVSCFARHVRRIVERENNHSLTIFVHTDSSEFREELKKALRFVKLKTKAYHPYYDAKLDGQVRVHAENVVLSNARHIVGFQSGFSRAAFLRGHAKSYTIIRPESCAQQ